MMLRGKLPVRGDDDRARGRSFDAEDAQQLGGLAIVARIERCRDAAAVGAAWPRVLGVIDVIESIRVAQLRQRVGLESECETEVEQSGVLAQRNGRGAVGDEADRG